VTCSWQTLVECWQHEHTKDLSKGPHWWPKH